MVVSIEKNTRVRDSAIWHLMRDYYDSAGCAAWQQDKVPHFALTNRYTASYYCQQLAHLCRQLWQAQPDETALILDLGAGSGEFAYHLLPQLKATLADELAAGKQFLYVLSDIVDSNIQSWQNQPALKAHAESGLLDFCYLDACQTCDTLSLKHQQRDIALSQQMLPILCIANYLLDSLPIDQLNFSSEQPHVADASITIDERYMRHGKITSHKKAHVNTRFKTALNTTDHPDLTRYLQHIIYQKPHKRVNFPTEALRFLERLQDTCGNGYVLLCSDLATLSEEDIKNSVRPMAIDKNTGAVWCHVDFFALQQWIQYQGGRMDTLHASTVLATQCIFSREAAALKTSPTEVPGQTHCFSPREAVQSIPRGRCDVYALKNCLQLFGLCEHLLYFFTTPFCHAAKNHPWFKAFLKAELHKENCFMLPNNTATASKLGQLCVAVGDFELAVTFLSQHTPKPNDWPHYRALREALEETGQHKQAKTLRWPLYSSAVLHCAHLAHKRLRRNMP